jgi:hypothetical protein
VNKGPVVLASKDLHLGSVIIEPSLKIQGYN